MYDKFIYNLKFITFLNINPYNINVINIFRRDIEMVITPDVPTLPFTMKKGAKYFELVAEPVEKELDWLTPWKNLILFISMDINFL